MAAVFGSPHNFEGLLFLRVIIPNRTLRALFWKLVLLKYELVLLKNEFVLLKKEELGLRLGSGLGLGLGLANIFFFGIIALMFYQE